MKKILLLYLITTLYSFGYDYPYKDPYLATVLATPKETIPIFDETSYKEINLDILNDKVPANLWYLEEFRFGLMAQKEKAPLIFLFAGTGSRYNSDKMVTMSRILYKRGFSVIMLPTSVDYNYIVSASKTHAPGYLKNDGIEMYDIMKKVLEKVKTKINYDDVYLTGYSLGGTMSLILGEIDSKEKYFDFKRIIAINPAVNLYDSAKLLDNYLDDNLSGEEELGELLKKIMLALMTTKGDNTQMNFDDTSVYSLFKKLDMDDDDLKILIGLVFRFTSIDVNYISDLMTKSGVYTDPNLVVKKNENMGEYFKKVNYSNFQNYIHRIGLKKYQTIYKNMTLDDLIKGSSLPMIEGYLKTADNIMIATNKDDIILTPNNLKYLEDTMKDKLKLYPYGGHCGNMFYKENVDYMTNYLLKGEK